MAKNLIPLNLTMVEHSTNDARSCAAMLRGTGDGREQVWLDFEKNHPEIVYQEILMAQFGHAARYGRVKVAGFSPRASKLMMGLVALAIVVF